MSKNGQYESFGSGILIATPTGGTVNTPVPFGVLQDVHLEVSGSNKLLHGQNMLPVAAGRGEIKMSLKAKIGRVSGQLYNSLFFGVTQSVGTTKLAVNEAGTVPGATAYTITVVNSATWVEDFGVVYSNTGIPLDRVSSAPAVGQYSVAAGVYTFAAADANAPMLLNYSYTDAVNGSTIAVGNPQQGVQPVFSCILQRSNNGVGERFKLWSCIAGKLSLPTKMADFGISEFDADCFCDSAGRTITIYTDK